jgi:hypothetical protein
MAYDLHRMMVELGKTMHFTPVGVLYYLHALRLPIAPTIRNDDLYPPHHKLYYDNPRFWCASFECESTLMPAPLSEPQDCAICLDSINAHTSNHTLPCNHTFHTDCFQFHQHKCLSASKTVSCPLCRKKLRRKDLLR